MHGLHRSAHPISVLFSRQMNSSAHKYSEMALFYCTWGTAVNQRLVSMATDSEPSQMPLAQKPWQQVSPRREEINTEANYSTCGILGANAIILRERDSASADKHQNHLVHDAFFWFNWVHLHSERPLWAQTASKDIQILKSLKISGEEEKRSSDETLLSERFIFILD